MRPASEESTRIPSRRGASRPRLLVFWEGGSAVHDLRAPASLVVGRAEDSDVHIPNESVSRRHALLVGDAGWTIEDLGSSNGTFVDGRKLGKGVKAPVEPRTVVKVGDARLLLDLDEDAADVRREVADAEAVAARGGPLDAPMQRVHRLVDLVADSILPVLLLGETGVGKGVLAEQLHRRSSRAAKPFVRLNCAAVPEGLLESELFGHERGAFTGAVQSKVGILETADAGTVFLDEIGEVPRPTQAKLLHVLEHGEVMRVGGVKPRAIDVRFVAATNRDLESLVASGTFRRDLYFRLAGVPVRIPPLRERTSEIRGMAKAFIAEACERSRRPAPALSEAAMARLVAHPWPGNIRELRNVVMRAALLCAGAAIQPEHLMLEEAGAYAESSTPVIAAAPTIRPPPFAEASDTLGQGGHLEGAVRDFERRRIGEALDRFGGHQGKAAEYLGISRRTLTKKLTDLDMPRPRKGRRDDDG